MPAGARIEVQPGAQIVEARAADVDEGQHPRQQGGYTPLHGAAHNGDAAIVQMLLAAGADPSLTNDEGKDARAFAAESGDAQTLSIVDGVP